MSFSTVLWPTKRHARRVLWLPLAMLLLAGGMAVSEERASGQLQFGEPVQEGAYYTIPILLHDDSAEVAAMDFRLQYDPQIFTPVTTEAGGVAVAAGKVVSANMTQPGEYTVVLMGLNRDTMGSGEVARIMLEANAHGFVDGSQLIIADPTMATWEGEEIPSHGESLWVQSRENDEETAPEQPDEETDSDSDSDPTDPAFGPVDPETPTPGTPLPPGMELNPRQVADALLGREDRDADEVRRMAENIARNAAEAIRLREQLPTPATGSPDAGGESPDGELADARAGFSDGLYSEERDASGAVIASAQDPDAVGADATNDGEASQGAGHEQDGAAQEARQRARAGFLWLFTGLLVLMIVVVLGIVRRRLLD